MKTTKNKTTSSETSATLDLETKNLSEATKNEVGEFLVEQILSSVASKKSPVTGEGFDPLSKDYKEYKVSEGGSSSPDLELTGDMLDALDFTTTDKGIVIGVFGKDAKKADGHNNLSGKSKLPERRFIPEEGQGFTSAIQTEVDRIVADAVAEDTKPPITKLKKIDNKTQLYDLLTPLFGLGSRAETRLAVLRSDLWTSELGALDLLRFL